MESPKSRQHKEKRLSYRRREHKNKRFYNSKAWRDTRDSYMRHYQHALFTHIPEGKWEGESMKADQVLYILSLGWLPCEICLRLYVAEAYDKVSEGKELDHIEPVNSEKALERDMYVCDLCSHTGGINYMDITAATELDPSPVVKCPKCGGYCEYVPIYGDPFSFDNLQLLCKRHHAKKSQRER